MLEADVFPFLFLFFLGKVREGRRINYNLPSEKILLHGHSIFGRTFYGKDGWDEKEIV